VAPISFAAGAARRRLLIAGDGNPLERVRARVARSPQGRFINAAITNVWLGAPEQADLARADARPQLFPFHLLPGRSSSRSSAILISGFDTDLRPGHGGLPFNRGTYRGSADAATGWATMFLAQTSTPRPLFVARR